LISKWAARVPTCGNAGAGPRDTSQLHLEGVDHVLGVHDVDQNVCENLRLQADLVGDQAEVHQS
jgi:hypothetical protein